MRMFQHVLRFVCVCVVNVEIMYVKAVCGNTDVYDGARVLNSRRQSTYLRHTQRAERLLLALKLVLKSTQRAL